MVCHLDAPNAKEASLIEEGTALIASLVATITMGSINNERVKLPAKTLGPRFMILTKTSKPNNP